MRFRISKVYLALELQKNNLEMRITYRRNTKSMWRIYLSISKRRCADYFCINKNNFGNLKVIFCKCTNKCLFFKLCQFLNFFFF